LGNWTGSFGIIIRDNDAKIVFPVDVETREKRLYEQCLCLHRLQQHAHNFQWERLEKNNLDRKKYNERDVFNEFLSDKNKADEEFRKNGSQKQVIVFDDYGVAGETEAVDGFLKDMDYVINKFTFSRKKPAIL